MEQLHQCPICEKESFSHHLTCIDDTVSKENFELTKCSDCSFVFTNPRPNSDEIGKYYESEDYISHSNSNKGLFNKVYQQVRNITLKEKKEIVDRYASSKKIVDYGCGTGEFLSYCVSGGYSGIGYEPDSGASSYASDNHGLTVEHPNKINGLIKDQYGVVTMWHVLEHVHELKSTIKALVESLKSDGAMIIAVPNHLSRDAKHYKENWAAYDVPRHLYHFDLNSISNLLQQFNMKLIDYIPMKFDSFYVSMLSEKIKSGKINYVNAVVQGTLSNLLASDKSYSSTIYVFKKAI